MTSLTRFLANQQKHADVFNAAAAYALRVQLDGLAEARVPWMRSAERLSRDRSLLPDYQAYEGIDKISGLLMSHHCSSCPLVSLSPCLPHSLFASSLSGCYTTAHPLLRPRQHSLSAHLLSSHSVSGGFVHHV